MALIDPPQYAHLPAGLVYGHPYLSPELRLSIQQIAGWMWLTRERGVAWGRGKPLGVQVGELATRWGISERTVQWRIQMLAEAGLLEAEYSGGGWVKLRLGAAVHDTEQTHTEGTNTQTHTNVANTNFTHTHTDSHTDHRPTPRNAIARDMENGAMPLREPLRELNNNIVVGVVSDPILDPEKNNNKQTIIIEVAQALEKAGLWPVTAQELAGDPWVTVDRVQRTLADLVRQEEAGQTWRTSQAAVLAANLKAHREPPAIPLADVGNERNGQSFIEDEYAGYINH